MGNCSFDVRKNPLMIEVDVESFAELADHALSQLPDDFARLLKNVAIIIEDDSPPGNPTLLGLYEGVPLTERAASHAGFLPDTITLFRNPILGICDSYEDVVRQIRVTLVHEIGHYFGMDEERLHDLGYG